MSVLFGAQSGDEACESREEVGRGSSEREGGVGGTGGAVGDVEQVEMSRIVQVRSPFTSSRHSVLTFTFRSRPEA
jgi:hypothetical protein